MEKEEFLEKLKIQFEEDDAEKLTFETSFLTLDGWDSLTQFSIVAFLEDDFGIEFKSEKFKQFDTPNALYEHVKSL